MLHDRDNDNDKYEGSDEPEYHFSEEEGGDFTDSEVPKETTPSQNESEPKSSAGGIRALAPSKRMMISLVVFLGLVYVVYKMVAPTSQQVPSTDITTPVATQPAPAQTQKPPVVQAAKPQQQTVPTMTQQAPVPVALPTPPPQIPVQSAVPETTQPMISSAPPQTVTTSPTTSIAQGQIIPVGQPAQQPVVQPQAMPQAPLPVAQSNVVPPPPIAQPPVQQMAVQPSMQQVPPTTMVSPQGVPQQVVQQTVQTVQSTPQQTASVTGMPSVQSQPPMLNPNQPMSGLNPMANDVNISALQADSARLMSQLQSDYVQKLNDFSSQNKALQDEIQTLNSRMSAMETQINQLVQALTRQGQQQNSGTVNEQPVPQEQPMEPKISYNVQAIIPGRAWLRSDNGETLTVAEGDVIKSLGRVVKIDPYDGVVEINTGNKVVSLSYGTTA